MSFNNLSTAIQFLILEYGDINIIYHYMKKNDIFMNYKSQLDEIYTSKMSKILHKDAFDNNSLVLSNYKPEIFNGFKFAILNKLNIINIYS